MPYKALYTLRQSIDEPFVDLGWFVQQASDIQWAESISLVRTTELDHNIICGFIVRRPHSANHGLTSNYQIVTSMGIASDPIKEKMVALKELMHIYRPMAEEQNASQLALDNSLRQFFGRSGVTPSFAVMSEYKALWMAFGLVCPEHIRQRYISQLNDGTIQLNQVAVALEISVHHARLIFSAQYDDEIGSLLN